MPKSIREAGVQEADFLAHVDKLSEDAFDDQCTGANPRYPLISELRNRSCWIPTTAANSSRRRSRCESRSCSGKG
ncbi:hypothetical protein LN650_12795 [Klebsiella pneumoniae subsp. pneumoniae]|nr:hypothetical protein [Klebsiella pneumoniae subsp. pneumoniae]